MWQFIIIYHVVPEGVQRRECLVILQLWFGPAALAPVPACEEKLAKHWQAQAKKEAEAALVKLKTRVRVFEGVQLVHLKWHNHL